MTSGYTIVVERSDGKPTGDTTERVAHTGHPRVGEEVQLGEKRYRVARVCHVDACPGDCLLSSAPFRYTAARVYVRPVPVRPARS